MLLAHRPKVLFVIVLLVPILVAYSQSNDVALQPWNAYWIHVPGEPVHDYGVYQFRKSFSLASKPDRFIVHVSADNRYKLFVNGRFASLGPARGEIYHWNYETIDLAPYLQAGTNLIAAQVWNFGDHRPEAQITWQTGFILEGDGETGKLVNTNKTWKCHRDKSYTPKEPLPIYSYYVVGPGETIDYNLSIKGWETQDYVDTTWTAAEQITQGLPKGLFGYGVGWMLVPRSIPQMELTTLRLQTVRQSQGIELPTGFPREKKSFTIPANSSVSFLLDQGYLADAYPVLYFSKGKNARITLGYAEALYVMEPGQSDQRQFHQKGNRNEIDGKQFVGLEDSLISDGSDDQEFTSLWWRTYRYIRVEVHTTNEPLVIEDLRGIFTGYPFQMNARFDAGNDTLNKILETGWRTARSCAMETYMDCPYYEQLQYVGDTRIQCLVSLYNSGDDRLMRNAINLIDESRMAEGATLSRYPTANAQEIPPFSLWWIGMIHDFWIYRDDSEFVRSKLPGIRQVLWFFSKFQSADGSLQDVPYWNFTDWCETNGWRDGVAPIGKDGHSAALDMQLLWAYQLAADLESHLGMKSFADKYTLAALQLKQAIRKRYWDATKSLFADRDEKDVFSQHTNSLAILTGVTTGSNAASLAGKIMKDPALTEATIYFKFYVYQALVKAGFGNGYLDWLDIWKKNLSMGMTTWAEISDINNTRSDCHAWGASPNIELYRIVLGIDSDAPGFRKIKINPHLGALTHAEGIIPHPKGSIQVAYQLNGSQWRIQATLPANVPGYLLWKDRRFELKPGKNTLVIMN